MEDPYQPPRDGSVNDGSIAGIWRGRIKGIATFVSVVTILAGAVALWWAHRHSLDLLRLRHDPPEFLPGWLWFVWNDLPRMPFWTGLFVSSVANCFLQLEKSVVALVLSLVGAVMVLGWGVILVLGVATG
jgi:hypothetical protein